MSLDGLRVNHAGLDTAAQDLYTAVKDIDDRMNRLESELAPLKSDWTGNAQTAYHTAKAKWDTAIQEMREPARPDEPDGPPVQRRVQGRRPARRRGVRHLMHT